MWHAILSSGFTYEWIFKEDSYLRDYRGVIHHGVVGRWALRSDTLEVYDTACRELPGAGRLIVGTYKMKLDGDEMILNPIEDPCPLRQSIAIRPWRKFRYP